MTLYSIMESISHLGKMARTSAWSEKPNAPVVNRRVRGRSLPWITLTIKDLMKKRDYHHKKAIKTNKELHWISYKRLRNAVSMKLPKEKASYYSNQPCEKLSLYTGYEKQDSRKLWKTLNELITNKKQHKTANAPASENLTATSFNEFFTSVVEELCGHYKSKSRLPDILTPRVAQNFVDQKVSTNLYFENECECFTGFSTHGKTDETAEGFYCFRVFGNTGKTRSASFWNGFSIGA